MYYRQPKYLNDFKCVGGTCTNSCCIGWRIDWKEEEINKIKNAPNCSEELRELCERSFKYNETAKRYVVVLGAKMRCPFLTEDNLCRIQRELGAKYLSYTCTIYPRDSTRTRSAVYKCCHMSCPEIMMKLLNDDSCMELMTAERKDRIKNVPFSVNLDSKDAMIKHPERKYSVEIKEFFYEIISDKTLPLETCIILGALAAQSLTKLVSEREYDRIPEALKSFRAQMHNAEQLQKIDNIKPNYNVKLGVTDKLIRKLTKLRTVDTFIDADGKPNIDYYKRAEQLLDKEFEDRSFAWRNMALNLLLELNTPIKLMDMSIFENYSVFVMSYVFIRYSTLAVMNHNDRLSGAEKTVAAANNDNFKLTFKVKIDPEQHLLKYNATLSRSLCHNDENLKKLLRELKDLGITSPAYLALLVK